ncbi:Uu.00g121280.m01.CDS01 [Anthostomella pinea]|uniref:Uu.00g121280.m01.CDS01 n=1 Tax=Anthostomella pinea TaxID=933095 RepID=A0AAI8VI01_9PEZI|nr:Uu.00g121280.m01.CDS01 [Anthostomella pinea]
MTLSPIFRLAVVASLALALLTTLTAAIPHARSVDASELVRKQVPADPRGVTTIITPDGVTVRYKRPGADGGVCETTPGVNSYSGYVDVDENTHMFFWFFEARNRPDEAPLTLWLNGGPGSDSLVGLFAELGPCNVSNLTTQLNPYSWNNESNILFLSQPVGVGFSYQDEVIGTVNGSGLPATSTQPDGRYGWADASHINTTKTAAIGVWAVLQALIQDLPIMDHTVQSRTFNLWTESYGGHWGPVFFSYFSDQNHAIQNGSSKGVALNMGSLGIINGMISAKIQMPFYPEFAHNNSYGVGINETVYQYMKMSWDFPAVDRSTPSGFAICAAASNFCSMYVETPFYWSTGRDAYDIRKHPEDEDDFAELVEFLNLASTQDAIGVSLNYTTTDNSRVSTAFGSTGDLVYPDMLADLVDLLSQGVSVHLMYGDADYICNWLGGEAVSLQVDYTHAQQFRSSGYTPFVVNGVEYGSTRQYSNFSFTRMYDSGHMVPRDQPGASLEYFRRVIHGLAVADGSQKITDGYDTNGVAHATHTNSMTSRTPYPTL